jgi:glycosyltransferase involved in cell wall biosynthesis
MPRASSLVPAAKTNDSRPRDSTRFPQSEGSARDTIRRNRIHGTARVLAPGRRRVPLRIQRPKTDHYSQRNHLPMVNGQKLIVVLPAYNAEQTLERTVRDVPDGLVDEYLLVDDASNDGTIAEAHRLNIPYVRHERNRGYGGNQKTCYSEALIRGADIVVMLHPDYQYTPKLLGAMAWLVASDQFDVVLGSRILGTGALSGGMPLYKYVANRFLTAVENILLGIKLSEYHTGYRAFSRRVLETLPLHEASDDFVFDNEMIAQAVAFDFRIGEISCPTKYFPEASSINFRRSVVYGLGVLRTAVRYRLHRWGMSRDVLFSRDGRRLSASTLSRPSVEHAVGSRG